MWGDPCLKLKSLAVVAVLLAGVWSLAGCGEKQFDVVLTVDGQSVSPSLYRMYQIQSYLEASSRAASVTDTIDGMSVPEWINDNTKTLLREWRYYTQAFDAAGLALSDAEETSLQQQITQGWQSAGAVYLRNGVDRESYAEFQRSAARMEKLFEQYCADLTDEEIQRYLDEEFLLIEYVQLPCFDADGELLGEEQRAELEQLAQDTMDEMRPESDFGALCAPAVEQSYQIGGFSSTENLTEEDYLFSTYLAKNASDDNAALAQQVAKVPVGGFGIYEDEQFILLFHRLPNWETQEDFEALRPSVLWEMRGDAFEAEGAKVWESYELVEDPEAVEWYAPLKLDLSAPTDAELAKADLSGDEENSASSGAEE